jgi:hypothetical protein
MENAGAFKSERDRGEISQQKHLAEQPSSYQSGVDWGWTALVQVRGFPPISTK